MIAPLICLLLGGMAMGSGSTLSDVIRQERPPVEVDTPVVVTKMVQPAYPEAARKARIEGMVRVQVFVNTKGVPEKAEIVGTDNEVFNESALQTLQQWRFKPAIANKKPVGVWVTIPIKYKLQVDKKN